MPISERGHCAHCQSLIIDPTTQVIHGRLTFCCANCAAAMEESGSGSDPHAFKHENDLRCDHCAAPIVDESTMETRGDQAFCCANCLHAMSGGLGLETERELDQGLF